MSSLPLRALIESALSEGPLGRVLRLLPGVEGAYWKFFCSPLGGHNFQFGYFDSYAAAAAAIPQRFRSGWNNAASARHYIDSSTQPSSYGVLFWLYRTLGAGMRLVDLGGGVGQMYRAFACRAAVPRDVRWIVVDVPAAVARGRELLGLEPSQGLSFETDLGAVARADVLHSSGAIQFMEDALPGMLDAFVDLPRWIVINKVVLSQRPTFWTLHNIGTGICTYQIFNEESFLSYFAQRGYIVRDRWRVSEMGMLIPFHPEGYVRYASGFCFERGDSLGSGTDG